MIVGMQWSITRKKVQKSISFLILRTIEHQLTHFWTTRPISWKTSCVLKTWTGIKCKNNPLSSDKSLQKNYLMIRFVIYVTLSDLLTFYFEIVHQAKFTLGQKSIFPPHKSIFENLNFCAKIRTFFIKVKYFNFRA